jgi:AdoMet-dependent rRNA methyltransferase SPB1
LGRRRIPGRACFAVGLCDFPAGRRCVSHVSVASPDPDPAAAAAPRAAPRARSHDTGLPKWFADEERKYLRPAPQITGAEYAAAKEELRAIDARPIKKVAEAKARKRKRLVGKLTQARQKAESIANQEDVPMKAKMREIEKVYSKARGGGGGRGRGRGDKKAPEKRGDEYKRKGRPLDGRIRSDKRGMDAAAKRSKGKGARRGGGGGGAKGKGRR